MKIFSFDDSEEDLKKTVEERRRDLKEFFSDDAAIKEPRKRKDPDDFFFDPDRDIPTQTQILRERRKRTRQNRALAMSDEDPDLAKIFELVNEFGSYEDVAWILGINQRTVRDWCNGISYPSGQSRIKLRKYLTKVAKEKENDSK